jgi:hypothetical protein
VGNGWCGVAWVGLHLAAFIIMAARASWGHIVAELERPGAKALLGVAAAVGSGVVGYGALHKDIAVLNYAVGVGSAGPSRLEQVQGDVAGVKADVAAVKTDLAAVKADVAAFKADVKADFATVKADAAAVKADVAAVKTDVAKLGEKLGAVERAVLDLHGIHSATVSPVTIVAAGSVLVAGALWMVTGRNSA